jgi:hypothetical protein
MNRTYPTFAAAALIAVSLPFAQAKTTSTSTVPAARVEAAFQTIAADAANVVSLTDNLSEMAKSSEYSPDLFLSRSHSIKAKINNIAAQLRFLNRHRSELTLAQAQELNRILPLMHNIAQNADKSITTLNADREHLWATSYPTYVNDIYNQADQVRTSVDDYLKLEKARNQEQRLSHELGTASGM